MTRFTCERSLLVCFVYDVNVDACADSRARLCGEFVGQAVDNKKDSEEHNYAELGSGIGDGSLTVCGGKLTLLVLIVVVCPECFRNVDL